MNAFAKTIGILILAGAAAAGGYFYGKTHVAEKAPEKAEAESTTQPSEEDKPVVEVTTTPLKRGSITQTITAYGTVLAQPGDVHAISVPFESRVVRMLVTAGQSVTPETEVAEVQASPDALVSLQEAKNALSAATLDLQQTKQKYDQHLATNQDLSQAQNAVTSARLKLDSLLQRGVDKQQKLKATSAGIVTKLDVQEGQIVPAGGPLAEIASGNHVEVRLGVEPEDIEAIKPQMSIALSRVNHADEKSIAGKVRMIEQRVDPATHLVEVLVSLPGNSSLLLDSFIVGQFNRSAENALIVPRDAALQDDDGNFTVFTAKDGKAVKHKVKIGLENDNETQVIADDLKENDPIVSAGNYQVSDGMAIQLKSASTQPTEGKEAAKDEKKDEDKK